MKKSKLHICRVLISGEYTLSKMIWSRSVLHFEFHQILKYLHIHNEIFGGWDTSLNTTYFKLYTHIHIPKAYIPYTYSQKEIIYNILNNFIY